MRDEGYQKIVTDVVGELLRKSGVEPETIASFCFPAAARRVASTLAKKLGIRDDAVADNLQANCGETGAAHPLIMLVNELEKAVGHSFVLGEEMIGDTMKRIQREKKRRHRQAGGSSSKLPKSKQLLSSALMKEEEESSSGPHQNPSSSSTDNMMETRSDDGSSSSSSGNNSIKRINMSGEVVLQNHQMTTKTTIEQQQQEENNSNEEEVSNESC